MSRSDRPDASQPEDPDDWTDRRRTLRRRHGDAAQHPMSDTRSPDGARPTGTDDVEAMQAQIEATRAQLSRTVDELHARLDVPARAKEKAYRAGDTVVETYRESPPLAIAATLALAAAVVGLMIWRSKSAGRREKKP
jgi:hypothetical protein